jgi:hypothetical protein
MEVVRDLYERRTGRKVIERLGHFQSAACVGTGSGAMMGMLRGVNFNVHILSAYGSEHARAIRQ